MSDDVKLANDKMQRKLIQEGCERFLCLMDSPTTKMSLNQTLKGSDNSQFHLSS